MAEYNKLTPLPFKGLTNILVYGWLFDKAAVGISTLWGYLAAKY